MVSKRKKAAKRKAKAKAKAKADSTENPSCELLTKLPREIRDMI